jgi:peptide/histidine transporter 3/4
LLTALSINGLTSMGCDWKSENDSLVTNTKFHWLILGNESHPCSVHVYVILVLIGFGVGFLRANIPPFGAEQVRAGGDNAVRQFFNAYYWCVNIGGLIGIGVLAYVEQNVENGFFISYLIATTALCASLIIFCAGKGFYIVHRPGNSVIINVFRILGTNLFLSFLSKILRYLIPSLSIGEATYNTCKKQDSVQGSPMFRRQSQQPVALVALTGSSWVDRAKVSHGGSFHDTTVEDVKSFCKTLVFIFVLLPYWLVYFQVINEKSY